MDQHNFEMIHFQCTIPAIGCTIPVLLRFADSWFDFEIWSSYEFMLQNEGFDENKTKNNMWHVH